MMFDINIKEYGYLVLYLNEVYPEVIVVPRPNDGYTVTFTLTIPEELDQQVIIAAVEAFIRGSQKP